VASDVDDATQLDPARPVPGVTIRTRDHRHYATPAVWRSVTGVDDRTTARFGAVTGLTATLAVGLTVLLAQLVGDASWGQVRAWWWPSYVLYLVAFAWDDELVGRRPRWLSNGVVVAIMVVTGIAAFLGSPDLGWTSVLLVVTAAAAAFVLPLRGVVTVVALQSATIGVGAVLQGLPLTQVVVSTLIYASFQGFAVLLVVGQQREAAARAEVEVTHAELRAATALLATSTRDAERLRIARELHDLVGHQLTALALELEVAAHHAHGPVAEHAGRARAIAKGLLDDVRDAVGELRAPGVGLAETLQAIVDPLPSLEVHLEVDQQVPLDHERAVAVVRCVQEVVTNTLRHAGARQLWVEVVVAADGLRIDARDDGVGVHRVRPGNGLTGMRERVEQLGGQLELDGGAGRGFHFGAWVPAA
jgi:signal transduction histidine kinase